MRFTKLTESKWCECLAQFLLVMSLGSMACGSSAVEDAIVKRADSSSSSKTSTSSSTSSSTTSSAAKCTGSRQECRKPTNITGLAVGLAIAIPAGIVILVCLVIFYKVYRRNKKEAQGDNDPDFVGDIDYLPSMDNHGYQISSISHSSNSNTPMEAKENYDNYFPPYYGNKNRVYSQPFQRNSNSRSVDPFILPQVTDENALRDFAKQIHGEDLGAYRLASNSNSRSASHYSLPFEKSQFKSSEHNGSSFTTSTFNDAVNLERNVTEQTGSCSSVESKAYQSPVKSTAGEVTKQYIEDNSGCDVEHSRNDTTIDESNSGVFDRSDLGITKPEPLKYKNGISRDTFNFEMMNGSGFDYQSPFEDTANEKYLPEKSQIVHEEAEKNDQAEIDDKNESNRILHLSAEEEENIQRMKSIYKVYLDRNATMKQNRIDGDGEGLEPSGEVEKPKETSVQVSSTRSVHPETENSLQPADFAPAPYENTSSNGTENKLQLPEETHPYRVASSIYSAVPSQIPASQSHQDQSMDAAVPQMTPLEKHGYASYGEPLQPAQFGQYSAQEYPSQEYPPQQYPPQQYPTQQYPTQQYPSENYPTQQYPSQQYPTQQYAVQGYPNHPYGNGQAFQQQYIHPQTFESIDELPTPTNLPNSSSSHSLTSFKPRAKQAQLTQLQAARINGTAVNPMDHPGMFYSQEGFPSYNNNGYGQPKAPYQLRQSIVMTNPSDLTAVPRFKPAGSIRNISAMNSRNNSMTTGTNFPQQQIYDNRVSGLLNEHDLVQPPSVSGILPHSSSQDDLRKQIGSSHNYSVV